MKRVKKFYNTKDFHNAVIGYGELEHDELMALTGGKPLIIDGFEVDSILDDGGLKFSYIAKNGVAYSRKFVLADINDIEICNKIYEFLCDNRNTNTDFFNSLA